MSAPAVSVVVIFWNAERFLPEAVASVRAQTLADWELLLVDDGSTDASSEQARRAAAADPERVRCLEHAGHQHLGTGATRDLGLAHARGRALSFLDADDVLLPPALEEQLALLDQHPDVGLVYGMLELWRSWNGGRDELQPLPPVVEAVLPPPVPLVLALRAQAWPPAGILVRTASARRVGGFEHAFRGLYEDQVFRAKLCLSEASFWSRRCWYRYRVHDDSTVMRASRAAAAAARDAYLGWLRDYLTSTGVQAPEVWRALRVAELEGRHPLVFKALTGSERKLRRAIVRGRSLWS